VPDELEVLPVRALIRLWNIELRLEVTLLEAPEPPSRLPSNSLLADSVARLVSAATVEAMFIEVPIVLADVLAGVAETWLLLTLPIDIITPVATAGIRGIGRNSKNLSKIFRLREILRPLRHPKSCLVANPGCIGNDTHRQDATGGKSNRPTAARTEGGVCVE
jgi:hypothetical protein